MSLTTVPASSTAPVSAPAAPPAPPAPVGGTQTPPAAPGAPAAPPAPPATDDRMAAKFAALTRKEQAAVAAQNGAKALAAQAAADKAEAQALRDKYEGFRGKPEKVLDLMKEFGVTYEQATQLYLNGGMATPEMTTAKLQEQIDALAAQRLRDIEEGKAAQSAEAKAAEARAVADFQGAIATHVADKAKFPLINHFNQVGQIYTLIDGHFNKTAERDAAGNMTKPGQILTIADASKMVEDYLVDQVKKSQELLAPPPPAPPAPANTPKPSPFKPASKTLAQAPAPVSTSKKPTSYKSDQQLRDEIVAKYSRK